ncbi:S46 family peptidase [Alistipes putredinis]|uniref:S46 family peptidase n=1 Tax=Alistipes putredinis TaxID=28117 RepID=UPI0024B08F08|nr:S46 family peptidase [Alistipes putredinis]
MKKFMLFLTAAILSWSAAADEGMWLLPYLQKMNIGDMKAKGCQLTAEDIYSVNRGSLKDAIVVFGQGCTGEIVSPEGLLFTNYHCGHSDIQGLSSEEHDYLKDGFWAMSNEEEIPAPGLTVRFVREIIDVTPRVINNVPEGIKGRNRLIFAYDNAIDLEKKLKKKHPGMEVTVESFFGGNQYFAFVMEEFWDVRLVGAPPTSIGKFGGETDNWMWPRHTGDFCVFRVYADKENKPADYSPDNVPYKTDGYLKISLDGYRENDFTMIMGFPGSTDRYATSYEIDEMTRVSGPQRIAIRGARQEILKEDMAASDKVRIQYASKYDMSSNYWKNTIGMIRGIDRLKVKSRKESAENAFQLWAIRNSSSEDEYNLALGMIFQAVEQNKPLLGPLQYLEEAMLNAVEIITPAYTAYEILGQKMKEAEAREELKEFYAGFYKDYNEPTDRKVAKKMIRMVRWNVKDLPEVLSSVIDTEFGGDIDAYVDYLYDNSVFVSEQRALSATPEQIEYDPAFILASSVIDKMNEWNRKSMDNRVEKMFGQYLYIRGLMERQPERAWYPDANFTIRLTYGRVLPYRLETGGVSDWYTTLDGVMAKEDTTSTEFIVPRRLKELYEAKDYGRYANEKGELPVAFLSDCDITGGNSGSPMMNGRGELIGLAFDGNWESMSCNVAFEPEVQRAIGVDVRYVLFVIDKFAGADWLLDEMTIVKDGVRI